jgi:regulator of protease activity HflC (stomatin/prohibitin superfamily)
MWWIVLTIILVICGVGGFFVGIASPEGRKLTPYAIAGGCLTLWLILTFFLSLHTVGQRQVGIVQSFSGTIGDNYKSHGLVFVAPWNHVKTEDIALQKEVFSFGSDNSAVSKDQQPITATIVVNYQVDPNDVISLWKNVGPAWKSVLLDGRVPQDFKETTAQFTSPEITLNRPRLRTMTLERLRRELCPPKGEFCVHIEDVFVQNVGYSQAYTQAIEDKQVQVQRAQQAQAKVAQAKAEADQTVATADGARRAAIARAEGDARAIELKGKALQHNPEVVRYEAIQKLAAQAEVIFCTTNNCPSILGSLDSGSSSGR